MTLSSVVDDSFNGLLPGAAENVENAAIETVMPDKSYRLDLRMGRISGIVDKKEAVTQGIFKRLMTDAGVHSIYSDSYGLKVNDLIGLPEVIVRSELQRRITESIMEDDRAVSATDFVFERREDALRVTFIANTIYGVIMLEREYET